MAKALALPHVQRWSLNALASSVQLKIKILKLATTEARENIHRNQTKENMSITHGHLAHKDRKWQCPKINWTLPIMRYQYLPRTFNANLPWLLTRKFYFMFSYSLCLAFRLCFRMIVFYTSLEVIKLAFLENKSRC